MNKQDRAQLAKAVVMIEEAKTIIEAADLSKAAALIEEAKEIVEEVSEAEQEKFDNLTEGLQAPERGQRMQEVAGELEGLVSTLDEVIENVNGFSDTLDNLDEAISIIESAQE